MTVPFHRLDKDGQQRLQPLPTDTIRRLPQHQVIVTIRPKYPCQKG